MTVRGTELELRRDARKYRKTLVDLTTAVRGHLKALDEIMKGKESAARGKLVAYLCNQLEMANDRARFFGLGIDYRTGKMPRRARR